VDPLEIKSGPLKGPILAPSRIGKTAVLFAAPRVVQDWGLHFIIMGAGTPERRRA